MPTGDRHDGWREASSPPHPAKPKKSTPKRCLYPIPLLAAGLRLREMSQPRAQGEPSFMRASTPTHISSLPLKTSS